MEFVIGLIIMFLFGFLVFSIIRSGIILINIENIILYLKNENKYRKEKRNLILCIKVIYKEYAKKYGIALIIIDTLALLCILSFIIFLILSSAYMLGSIIIEK